MREWLIHLCFDGGLCVCTQRPGSVDRCKLHLTAKHLADMDLRGQGKSLCKHAKQGMNLRDA